MIPHVAKAQREWLDEGQKCVPISVNVSRAHFIESDLAEQIRDLVDAYSVPHELIEIELMESAFFDDKKAMIHTIEKFKEYGFAVSMDDFGSGYSSLNSLKYFAKPMSAEDYRERMIQRVNAGGGGTFKM